LNNHPALGDVILQAFIARRQLLREPGTFTGLRVIGSRYSADTFRIRDFLSKNRVLFTWLDLEADSQVQELLSTFGVAVAETPVVAWGQKLLLRHHSDRQLAETLGLRQPLQQMVYDLIVAGAGPAGLAAAVYGASEGLRTLVLERSGPGGQAGRSMRIENYLGFPTGITGSELTDRAVVQANKFGARGACTATVISAKSKWSATRPAWGKSSTPARCLVSSGRCHGPIGSLPTSRATPKDSSAPGQPWCSPVTGAADVHRSCWRPAAPAYSLPVTCAPARSSVSPQLWAKGPWRFSSCTST
jgi:thioredoxin reductase (NADPH)